MICTITVHLLTTANQIADMEAVSSRGGSVNIIESNMYSIKLFCKLALSSRSGPTVLLIWHHQTQRVPHSFLPTYSVNSSVMHLSAFLDWQKSISPLNKMQFHCNSAQCLLPLPVPTFCRFPDALNWNLPCLYLWRSPTRFGLKLTAEWSVN